MKRNIKTKHENHRIYESIWLGPNNRKFEPLYHYGIGLKWITCETEQEIIDNLISIWYTDDEKIKYKTKRLHGILYVIFDGIDPMYDEPFRKIIAIV